MERKTVEADRFVLRDTEGRVRAELALTEAGEPGFALLDEQGQRRAELTLSTSLGPRLALFSNEGKSRVTIGGGSQFGGPSVDLHDPEGNTRASLMFIDPIGSASLQFQGRLGEPRALFGTVDVPDGEKGTVFGMHDDNGQARVRIRVLEDGSAGIEVLGGESVTLASNGFFLADEHGAYRVKLSSKGLGILDHVGNTRVAAGVSEETNWSHVILFDPQGVARMDLVVDSDRQSHIFRKRWWWPFWS